MPTSTVAKQITASTTRKPSTKRSVGGCTDCGAPKKKQNKDLSGEVIISPAMMEVFEDFAETYKNFDYENAIRSTG